MSPPRSLLVVPALCALAGEAAAKDFATPAKAMSYLTAALPQATAANPKYRTVKDGTVSQWLTQELRFSGADPVRVEMRETYTQEKDGKTTPGTHEAAFSFADVEITEFTEAGDVTPEGAPSRGVMFTCKTPGCVSAKWGAQASKADHTDISIQDDATRANMLAAFRRLKSGAGQ